MILTWNTCFVVFVELEVLWTVARVTPFTV